MSSFTHAGVSKLNGEFKVRYANDAMRTKVLIKNNHTDIDIVELKNAMTKEDAIAYLLSIDFATKNGVTNKAVQAALEAEVSKRTDQPKAANKQPKKTNEAKKPKKAKSTPSLDAIAARAKATKPAVTKAEVTKQLEDAPY
jgi:hypothetical protein